MDNLKVEPVSDEVKTLLLTSLWEEEVKLIEADKAMQEAEIDFTHWQNRVDALRSYIEIIKDNPVKTERVFKLGKI